MSWVDVVWVTPAAACLTLAALHLLVWARIREAWANLAFAALALAVLGIGVSELTMMGAATPADYGRALRWIQVPLFAAVAMSVLFLRLYFGTGRLWLAHAAWGSRLLVLIVNFTQSPNINYREIVAVRHVAFLGQTVVVAEGPLNPWTWLARLSSLVMLVFIADATIAYWRRADRAGRRRVWTVGGAFFAFIGASAVHAILIQSGALHSPYFVSLFFVGAVAAMGSELTHDVVRAADLSRRLERSEARLRESEEEVALAAEAAQLGAWAWDVAADRVWGTDRARELFGLDRRDEQPLARWLERVPPEDREKMQRAIRQASDADADLRADCRVLSDDGAVRWVSSRGRVDRRAGGQPTVLRIVSIDITARKRAEERLAQSEARLRGIFDSAMDAIVTMDETYRIVLFNPTAEAMFRCTANDVVGQRFDRLIPERLREEYGAQLARFAESATGSRAVGPVPAIGLRAGGEEFPMEGSVSLVTLAGGKLLTMGIRDVTEHRRLEVDAQRSRDEIAHLSRVGVVTELSGSLAHELNQPLGAILSNTEAIRRLLTHERPDLAEVRAILNDIVADDQRAGEVIQRVRLLLRKGAVQPELLDVADVVRQVLRLAGRELADRGVVLHADLATGLPPVRGDRVQLQQVLLNLVMNATEAMADVPPDERVARVCAERLDGGGVRVSVSDNGPGIAPEMVEDIFQPFISTKPWGMGMGLAICRTIVTAHGGRLWVTNDPGAGATFQFTLPAAAART
jgi:PAS domain S-box-containing protein